MRLPGASSSCTGGPPSWIPPWLIGLGIISYLGQYPTSAPSSGWPFGIALLAKQDIPFWVDLGVVAAWSLVIYFWAAHVAMPTEYVKQAVEVVDEEANLAALTQEHEAAPVA